MKKIAEYEDLNGVGNMIRKGKLNATAYWAYWNSAEAENELIDFNEVIWEKDIDEIVALFERNDITEFTISCTFTSLLETVSEFEKRGFKLDGIVEVNAGYVEFSTGQMKKIPAGHLARV